MYVAGLAVTPRPGSNLRRPTRLLAVTERTLDNEPNSLQRNRCHSEDTDSTHR
jgi:hypothetical protein